MIAPFRSNRGTAPNDACAHDSRLRARAIGIWTAPGGVAIAAGPVVGGLLLTGLGWRSIFLVKRVFEKSRFCHISQTMVPHSSFQTAGANPGPHTVSLDLAGLFKHPLRDPSLYDDAGSATTSAHAR
jgi:hypothetical protein